MKLQLFALLGAAALAADAWCQDENRRAFFRDVRWVPEVKIDGRWYRLKAIEGVPVRDVISFIKKHDDEWARRFTEDLVENLNEMGKKPGQTVTLTVHDLAAGKHRTLNKVPVTEENRSAIIRLKSRRMKQAQADVVDTFAAALNGRWSYRRAGDNGFDAAAAGLRKRVAELPPDQLGVELQKIIALGIDGHAGVGGYRVPPGARLPFLVEPTGGRFVAFRPGREAFLANGFPYLTKIDGVPVAEWLDAAAVLVPKGSPQYVRRHALRGLRELDYVRGLLELPKGSTVEVELAAADGESRKTLTLPVATSRPLYGEWPRGGSRLLEGDVGYLRLKDMDRDALREIGRWMPKFRNTAGLVVDVRDNGGGARDPLRLLYSYLADPAAPPRVVNAAKYRLHPAHPKDHLEARFMYRADDKRWTAAERRAVAAFAAKFRPTWRPPAGRFSDWHYMALSRLRDAEIFHYNKPVVILMNAKCFSATDIFLAGLKGMKNVTLMGTASGGGSARAQTIGLGSTGLRLRIGSMASFQPGGRLFDGVGVAPDVTIEPAPEYFIGDDDNVLAAAVRRIKGVR